mmetsp:Transcript_13088/g.52414  ORF Transcript_13088/g.52414 Transcript_13088/m.52414 type:complete len:127 (-) Transcript_13088:731-1111(-)
MCARSRTGPGKWVRFGLGICSVGCVRPRACCVAHGHYCCCALSGALPPDEEFAKTIACFGVVCKPRCACCPRLHRVEKGVPVIGGRPSTTRPPAETAGGGAIEAQPMRTGSPEAGAASSAGGGAVV